MKKKKQMMNSTLKKHVIKIARFMKLLIWQENLKLKILKEDKDNKNKKWFEKPLWLFFFPINDVIVIHIYIYIKTIFLFQKICFINL